eukprot:c3078_g2_i1 orf=89-412(+)
MIFKKQCSLTSFFTILHLIIFSIRFIDSVRTKNSLHGQPPPPLFKAKSATLQGFQPMFSFLCSLEPTSSLYILACERLLTGSSGAENATQLGGSSGFRFSCALRGFL